jgi:hypothetical protein
MTLMFKEVATCWFFLGEQLENLALARGQQIVNVRTALLLERDVLLSWIRLIGRRTYLARPPQLRGSSP